MKKLSKKQRDRDVRMGLLQRKKFKRPHARKNSSTRNTSWINTNKWIDSLRGSGLNFRIAKNHNVTLYLPEKMNFSSEYDTTILHILAIRKLVENRRLPYKAYKLATVNFDELRKISTSAALVLTAELSKWDDASRQKLRPIIDKWDPEILRQFADLGFFNLFHNNPIKKMKDVTPKKAHINLVKYIKGRCGDSDKTRILKSELLKIVGDKINKWTFLHGGLTEAITNVSHHAYPNNYGFFQHDKNWYLTGSYNDSTKVLKIVFYDQGIGIPKSLPASDIWERALEFLSSIPAAERKRDEVLLKAAVQLDRTSTKKNDRGKGLQDLLEFIRQRKDGYLSILSLKGLYKFTTVNGRDIIKSEHFGNPMPGTLIIWSATLLN